MNINLVEYVGKCSKSLSNHPPIAPSRHCENTKSQTLQILICSGHEDARTQRFHEVHNIDFINLRVSSRLCAFVAKIDGDVFDLDFPHSLSKGDTSRINLNRTTRYIIFH